MQKIVVRFATLSAVTETADPTFGFDYSSSATSFGNAFAITTVKIPASQNGFISATLGGITAGNLGSVLGLKISGTNGAFGTFDYGLFASGGAYFFLTAGSPTNTGSGLTPAANDVMKLTVSGTTVVGQISQNGGTSFTTVQTWTGYGGGPVFGCCDVLSTSPLQQVAGSTNWA